MRAAGPDAEVTKVSINAYGHGLRDRFVLLRAGGAAGFGVGPIIVSKSKREVGGRIAIPGERTTAALLLSNSAASTRVVMRFDQIEDAVLRGDADCGVLIHEGRFTYESKGLTLLADLGEVWEERMHCPLPLAAIAIRRDLAHLAPADRRALQASVEYAFAHPDASRQYVAAHAQEMDPDVTERHIQLYVNDYTRALDEAAVMGCWSGANRKVSSRRAANRCPSSSISRLLTAWPAGAAGAAGAAAGAGTLPPASTICFASTLTTVASFRSAERYAARNNCSLRFFNIELMPSFTSGMLRSFWPFLSLATTSTMVWAPPWLTSCTVPGFDLQHRVTQRRRRLGQRRHRHEAEIAAALRRFRVFGKVRGEVAERDAFLQSLHQHLRLGRRFLRRARIIARAVGALLLADRRDHDLRDADGILGAIELRLVRVEKRLDVGFARRRLLADFLVDDLLREQVAAQILAHLGGGQVALLQLLVKRRRRDVLLRLVVGVLELGFGELDLELLGLGEQDVLHDQLVQQVELRGVGLFFRRLRVLRRGPSVRLFHVISRDLVAVDDRPCRCGRRRRCSGSRRPARRGNDDQGEQSGHPKAARESKRVHIHRHYSM